MAETSSVPELNLLQTLPSPTGLTRTWCSRAHPDPRTPLLATATSDKQVHIWDLRTYKLLSSISGGHKRSVRCVGWKDFGQHKRLRTKASGTAATTAAGDVGDEQESVEKPASVLLATGSFDANCGLWVWRRNPLDQQSHTQTHTSQDSPNDEQDFTNADEEEDDDDWHFSTLLTGPDSEIKDVEFSPAHYGSNFLATCSRDKSVWVWEEVEEEEWETVAVLAEHAGDVKCVGWCAGGALGEARRRRRERRRRRVGEGEGKVVEDAYGEGDDEIIGCREILASGSYDDTIRLWRDVEEEGDWTCVGILEGHGGTVWDLKWESYIDLDLYPDGTTDEDIRGDWEPRMISCSDDLTIRVWTRELSESEKEKKRERALQKSQGEGSQLQTGFSSTRLPSVIRPPSGLERWREEVKLPQVHVRSVYAVDWSKRTGLVVSCGGDGTIAVYKEVEEDTPHEKEDVVMSGTDEQTQTNGSVKYEHESLRKRTKWVVVALFEAAHEEYEINHVCWAPLHGHSRERGTDYSADEEVVVSTGDDGNVMIWRLPPGVSEP